MNNVDALLAAIDRDPDDVTAVCALTDALIEEQDMTRAEANVRAERAVQTARDARDTRAAAELLRRGQPWHEELVQDILYTACLEAVSPAQIVIVPGDSKPMCSDAPNVSQCQFWSGYTVTVGALWVVRHYRTNASLCLMPKPKKQRHARPS